MNPPRVCGASAGGRGRPSIRSSSARGLPTPQSSMRCVVPLTGSVSFQIFIAERAHHEIGRRPHPALAFDRCELGRRVAQRMARPSSFREPCVVHGVRHRACARARLHDCAPPTSQPARPGRECRFGRRGDHAMNQQWRERSEIAFASLSPCVFTKSTSTASSPTRTRRPAS